MPEFIPPEWIKYSEWPANVLPVGTIGIDQASEDGELTVKGFYDPATGEVHIQEVLRHNLSAPAQSQAPNPKSKTL